MSARKRSPMQKQLELEISHTALGVSQLTGPIPISSLPRPAVKGEKIQKIQSFVCNTSRDIIRYFSTVAREDPVYIYIYIFKINSMTQAVIKHV